MIELLNEIDDILYCPRCDLALSRTKVVIGSGPMDARIMLIGEAPGRNEDKKGEPFVGAAGRRLNTILEDSGINRKEVYITNVVKCRPPGNRPPRAYEVEACSQYLKRQIEAISPEAIVLMGRTAAEAVLGRKVEMSAEHGTVIEKDGIRYMITYHPAAAIYRRALQEELARDFKKVSALLMEG
jgi:DNA polymerase